MSTYLLKQLQLLSMMKKLKVQNIQCLLRLVEKYLVFHLYRQNLNTGGEIYSARHRKTVEFAV